MTTVSTGAPWDLKNLVAWQIAMDMAETVYRETRGFPDDERFGLRSQLRRAAVSVASNIAEGHGRSNNREFRRYLAIARGSLKEVETQLLLAHRLGYLVINDSSDLLTMINRLNRLLTGLRKRLS